MRTICYVFVALVLAVFGFSSCNDAGGEDADTHVSEPDVAAPEDLAAADFSFTEIVGDDVQPELSSDLAAADGLTPACAPGEGCFLDPCVENSDCQSGWCVDHMGEGVCTQTCAEECPAGWSCQQVAGTDPDVVFICVSHLANLCRPCADAGDCQSLGGVEDVCLDYEAEGSFCGAPCDPEDVKSTCPWGFACQETETIDGIPVTQCVADAGVCPCTAKAVQLALWTPCAVENEWGLCGGKRVCTTEGLTACDASTPATEVCNGVDDDCDGEIDEPNLVDGGYEELCDDGNPCTEDGCAAADGCTHAALSEGECVDGDACTVGDHCDGGICLGSPVACDDDNPCTDDVCDGLGGCDFLPNDEDCDDADPCTVADQCEAGVCVGVPVSCECVTDEDCASLEDGDLCNGTLLCDNTALPYQCAVDPATVVLCPGPPAGPDQLCLAAACDPLDGACGLVASNEGFLCDDGDPCTTGDTCAAGLCEAGASVNCSDGNPCTDDSCSPAEGCLHVDNAAPCDDGNTCTAGDHCSGGACVYDELATCDDGNLCTTESCDPVNGCVYVLNQVPCDDGDMCTLGDHCHLGGCIAGGALNCNDGNLCTDDGCDPATGCIFTANAAPCDDGNLCTEGDHCAGGACTFDGALACDDGDLCTDDSCDPLTGCVFVQNTAPCDDNDLCTIGDHCHLGGCVSDGSLTCDDGNPCTDDACLPETGCSFAPNVEACDDGDPCTVGDHCTGGWCLSVPMDCGDGSPCVDGLCQCQPDCDGKECGDDGCDGVCGVCSVGTCVEGVCVVPTGKRVFVTSTLTTAGLGGVSGADSFCQQRADAANLGGSWRAWISLSGSSAAQRFAHSATGYALVSGTVVATSWADLTDGSLQHGISLDEYGNPVAAGHVWTATKADGSYNSDSWGGCGGTLCGGFTIGGTCNSGSGGFGGDSGKTTDEWTDTVCGCCNNDWRLYCFEQ